MTWLANDKWNATLSSGYTVGQTTLSVSSTPDNVPTIVTAAKGTDNEIVFSVTGKTINSLTGVTRLRGANVNLDATTPITCLNNQEFINQYETAVSSAESLASVLYAVDGGSSDDYVISLDPAPSEYTEGLMIAFKANTANAGPATLNVNSLGQVAIKKLNDQDLEDGDIEADQIVIVIYDGTYFQLQSDLTRITSRVGTTTSSATPTINTDSYDAYSITALATDITSMTTNLSGTPTNFQKLIIRIKDNGTARAITWGASFEAKGTALPTITVISKVLTVGFIYDTVTSKWGCVASQQET